MQRQWREEVVVDTPVQRAAGRWEAHEGRDYEYIPKLHTEIQNHAEWGDVQSKKNVREMYSEAGTSRLWREAPVNVLKLWMRLNEAGRRKLSVK